jgi:hypothetical protein
MIILLNFQSIAGYYEKTKTRNFCLEISSAIDLMVRTKKA